jgi:hypothetical protein
LWRRQIFTLRHTEIVAGRVHLATVQGENLANTAATVSQKSQHRQIEQSFLPDRTFTTIAATNALHGGEKRMTQISNVADRWPILRIAACVTLVFCCSAPVVWLVSNFLVSGVRALYH